MNWGNKRTVRASQILAILCMIEIASLLPLVFIGENLMIFYIEPSIVSLCKYLVYIDAVLIAVSMPTAIILLGKYLEAKNKQN